MIYKTDKIESGYVEKAGLTAKKIRLFTNFVIWIMVYFFLSAILCSDLFVTVFIFER